MKNKISKKIGGTMGPKRKSAPKPIVSNKIIARRVSKNPSVKSYNVSKKYTPGLSTGINGTRISTSAKRTMSPSVAPSKFEQKKTKAMNKYQSKVAKKVHSDNRKEAKHAKRAQSMKQREVIRNIRKTGRPEAPLQNGKELKPIMIKPNMGRIVKPMAKFPDLSGDGKVTKKDILMGKGVIDKPKMKKNNKSKTEANVMKGVTISATDPMKDALLEASRHGKNALKLMRQGDVEGAKAANELKMIAARQAKDIEFDRLKGGAIDRLTLR